MRIFRPTATCAILAVAALFVAACGSPGSADTAGAGPSAYPAWSTVTPTATLTPTATPYVPVANPTPIAKPTGCGDYGYAGRAADGDPNIDTYWLTDPPESQADAAFAVAQSLCIAGGRYVPSGDVRFKKADYSQDQLREWYETLNQSTWKIDTITSSSLSIGRNRITYDVLTPLGAGQLRELIAAAGVPPEAVDIEQWPLAHISEPPPNPTEQPDLSLSVNLPDVLDTGESSTFKVSLRNHVLSWPKIEYNAAHPVDLIIYSEDGVQEWRLNSGWMILPARVSRIWPWSSLSFEVEWSGTDDDKLPLEPGQYWVRAFFDFTLEGSEDRRVEMSTHPVPFQVLEP